MVHGPARTRREIALRRALLVALGLGVTAGAAPAPRPGPTGCQPVRPEWLWCDDFEQDRSGRYFEVVTQQGAFVRADGVGRNGTWGMRARFEVGQVSAGALHLALGRTPQPYFRPATQADAVYREIWWRVWLRLEPGWSGGGGFKLSRATIFSSKNTWAQAAIAHVWSGGPGGKHLVLDPARGTSPDGRVVTARYNDFSRLRWIGSARSATPLFERPDTNWHCVEAHARLNDAGAANGVFELWVDGRLEARRARLDWVGSYSEYGWNAVFLENYWNDGSPRAQERYFDDFVVSTRAIGCGDS